MTRTLGPVLFLRFPCGPCPLFCFSLAVKMRGTGEPLVGLALIVSSAPKLRGSARDLLQGQLDGRELTIGDFHFSALVAHAQSLPTS